MTFQDPLRTAERARAALEGTRKDTGGWSDDLRQRFDDQRFKPLTDAGTQLIAALKKAQQQRDAVNRLLAQ